MIPVFTPAQVAFNNEDSIFSFLKRHNITAKINALQEEQAIATRNAAIANIINFKNPLNFSATNNLQLPVNFILAEAFGGPTGTYKTITLGQQYVSNFNFTPQIDLINPQSWSKLRSAELNIETTRLNNQLTMRTVYETATAAYYNIASLNDQISSTEELIKGATTIHQIVSQKFQTGLARSQEVNNANATLITLRDRLAQLLYLKQQQETALRNLCHIPTSQPMTIHWDKMQAVPQTPTPQSNLLSRTAELQNRMLTSELRAARLAMLPVVSLIYYQGWQKNSNVSFNDKATEWIPSKYIGLKIALPFPPDVNRITASYTARINASIATLNAMQAQQQNETGNELLMSEYNRNVVAWESARDLAQLRNENYQASLQQYKEGLVSTEIMLTALNDYLSATASLSNSQALLMQSRAKIKINNLIQ